MSDEVWHIVTNADGTAALFVDGQQVDVAEDVDEAEYLARNQGATSISVQEADGYWTTR